MKRLLTVFLLALFAFVWSGCSEKNYFESQNVKGAIHYDGELPSPIVEIGMEAATLENGQFVTKEGGLQLYRLPEGYYFVSRTGRRIVAAGDCKPNIVYDLDSKRSLTLNLPRRIVAALIVPESDMLAFVLEGNIYGIYNLVTGKIVAKYSSDPALSADIRIANPMMLDQLLLVPTLDGKLIIMNKLTGEKIREIIVGKGEDFNNIIYLNVIGDRLVAATPHRIISVSPKIMDAQVMEIADVIFVADAIYILGKDGTIYHCDVDLKILNKKKFPFAHFVGAIYGEFIYIVEREGFIIATDPGLVDANVFELPDKIDKWFFTTPDAFYFDKYYFKLNRAVPDTESSEKSKNVAAETTENDARSDVFKADVKSLQEPQDDSQREEWSVEGLWDSIKGIFTPDDSNTTLQDDD